MSGDPPEDLLRLTTLTAQNYRGFESLTLDLDPSVTLLFGENGAGKSNVLAAIATALAGLWQKADINLVGSDAYEAEVQPLGGRQGAFPISLELAGTLRGRRVTFGRELRTPDGRTTNAGLKEVRELFGELVIAQSVPLPLIAWYGTGRLHARSKDVARKRPKAGRRLDGWVDCLDPRSSEEQLLQWWFEASLPRLQGQPSLAYDALVRLLRAVGGQPAADGTVDAVVSVDMELPDGVPILRMESGRSMRWDQLSDGYHVFLGLVVDLARRAWTLNAGVIEDPMLDAEGVVLIDELDLHLHPRWQAVVVGNLVAAFPRLQFVLTTHSPIVLSSVENHQVRRLSQGRLRASAAKVHGRDPNAVLQDVQGAPIRPPWVREKLSQVADAIDRGDAARARSLLSELEAEWGGEDAELARLHGWLGWEE